MDNHFNDADGNPAGGISTGIGYTIAWQNGPCQAEPAGADGVHPGRNGAFLIEVLEACYVKLQHYQLASKFACAENESAMKNIEAAIRDLNLRLGRRERAGTLGTHKPD